MTQYIHRAIHKYGIESFEYGVVEVYDEPVTDELKDLLDEREKYFIKLFDAYDNGYNLTLGGNAGVRGLKMSEEQKRLISENSKRKALDGRYMVYCYDIINDRYFTSLNTTELSKTINKKILSSDIKHFITKQQYILARTQELLDEKVSKYKKYNQSIKNKKYYSINNTYNCSIQNGNGKSDKNMSGQFMSQFTDEMKNDILNGMKEKQFKEKYNVCKKTYYNYKKLVFPEHKREYKASYDRQQFHEFVKTHSKEECMTRFNLKERRYYKAKEYDELHYDEFENK